MNISNEIHRVRKLNGLTQEKFAELVGVSRQAVAKWESGESVPELDRLLIISDKFRVSMDILIKGEVPCSLPSGAKSVDSLDVREFLCRAKINTYAGKGAEVSSSRVKSHDLQYSEDELLYLDTYLGSTKFTGEEAVWVSSTPVWAMNYTGRVIGDSFSGDFLKECLSMVIPENPFRGPELYSSGDYTYCCKTIGDFSWFSGTEEIYFRGIKVYECLFHGGAVTE
ncbi:MAG: DUF5680 domain-containing protein [Spirochaetaceae bacterium]